MENVIMENVYATLDGKVRTAHKNNATAMVTENA